MPRDTKLDDILVDWEEFRATRTQLGAAFVRILGYFREDGTKSVAAIEEAMRASDARGMVMPAHTLKSEARQFGGEKLGAVAEDIEMFARHCVESQISPDEYLPRVVELRKLFEETLSALEREANPLVQRRPAGFGRAVGY
ncbi:MAG: histidine phosphotransferase [Alphaproteobacteria bacterium HGW-Alphaproteobacteria-17]|nr:MAG: histidine phosphotransferase [Alphaproteobacteria bacterium HGW-Alphaproteobacteria-17]